MSLVGQWNVYDGVDVSDDKAVTKAAKRVKNDGGAIDVVINNAGYFYGPCEVSNYIIICAYFLCIY